jgi:hypothetical protein
MHSHTPFYRSGVSKKTGTGNDLLIIVNDLLTIAPLASRLEWICHSAANNAAGVGPKAANSANINQRIGWMKDSRSLRRQSFS